MFEELYVEIDEEGERPPRRTEIGNYLSDVYGRRLRKSRTKVSVYFESSVDNELRKLVGSAR